jgi:ribosomal protein S18 acetylase RimI-like enzyme
MKSYSHDNPDAIPIIERISAYTREAVARNMPYWIFVDNNAEIGILIVGKEPVRLLAKFGTPMALLYLIDMKAKESILKEFIKDALSLAIKKKCEYVSTTIPSSQEDVKSSFLTAGFQVFDNAHRMVHHLDSEFEISDELIFKPVERKELREYVRLATDFLKGSPDVMLVTALNHMLEVSDEFLDAHHSQMNSFIVEKQEEPIGILDVSTTSGLIGTVGVHPNHRGKGYGRAIISFGLMKLKESKCKQAYLRVDVNNKAAINLYKSLGFNVIGDYLSLIWRNK